MFAMEATSFETDWTHEIFEHLRIYIIRNTLYLNYNTKAKFQMQTFISRSRLKEAISQPEGIFILMVSVRVRLIALSVILFSCGNHEVSQNGAMQEADAHANDEWRSLFDGKTMTGWRGINQETFPRDGWKVEDGILMVNATDGKESGNGGDIITVAQYGDFVLEWEWKMLTKGGNSGVKYFVKEGLSDNNKYGVGLEYQILDDENFSWMKDGRMKPDDYRTLASLYEIYPATNKSPKPLGEWNHSRIVAKGNHVEHWLNHVKVLEFERGSDDFRKKVAESKFAEYENFGEAREGHILIQDHGSRMAFRNIKIKEVH